MEYEVTKATYDKIAHRYAELHFDFKFWKKPYEDMMQLVPKGGLFLDAGCGPGRDTKFFLENGYNVVSIDYSDGMLEEARKRVPNGKFQKMDMLRIELPDSHFDAVWACASLLHTKKEDANTVIQGFKRVLKTRGVLFIAVKQGEGSLVKEYPDGSKRFFANYNQDELRELAVRNGFEVVETYSKTDRDGEIWLCVIARNVNP